MNLKIKYLLALIASMIMIYWTGCGYIDDSADSMKYTQIDQSEYNTDEIDNEKNQYAKYGIKMKQYPIEELIFFIFGETVKESDLDENIVWKSGNKTLKSYCLNSMVEYYNNSYSTSYMWFIIPGNSLWINQDFFYEAYLDEAEENETWSTCKAYCDALVKAAEFPYTQCKSFVLDAEIGNYDPAARECVPDDKEAWTSEDDAFVFLYHIEKIEQIPYTSITGEDTACIIYHPQRGLISATFPMLPQIESKEDAVIIDEEEMHSKVEHLCEWYDVALKDIDIVDYSISYIIDSKTVDYGDATGQLIPCWKVSFYVNQTDFLETRLFFGRSFLPDSQGHMVVDAATGIPNEFGY